MTFLSAGTPALILAGQGRQIHAFGDEFTFLLEGIHTGGKCTVFLEVTAPGGGPPPHYHVEQEEWFYVMEGRVAFLVDGAWKEAGAGASAFIPRGAVHSFKNVGDQPLHMMVTVSPSGFETFMTRCSEVFAQAGPPDMNRLIAIAGEHGIHFAEG
jgi:quercetin dioxygenase-like cupin family protein